MKHLLKLGGMTPEEILHILDVADEYKRLHKDGVDPKDLQGKAVALVFAKNSTRTRTSLEVGIYQMGGLGTYLSAGDLQTARGEPVQDTARVLGRYYDAIVCRTYKQTTLDMLAKYSGIPVVSGMTDYAHPLQVLTDLMTVRERKGTLAGLKAGFVGDGYNMANSVIVGCLAVGMTVTIACPKGYRPAADVLMLAKQYGDKFTLTNDPDEAARDADVLFTDVWVSMGMEREAEQRRRDFTGFTLDAARMALAKPDCMVQHPLPAHRGEEIAPDVLEAHADEIFDEAENRIYVEKAVLAVLLAVCIGSFGFDTFTEKVLDIPAGSVGEALSVPMQQTARYIRDYGNEVTDDERTAIEKVLDCDAIAQSYMPELSDGVKKYYKNPGKGDLTRYMLDWAKMLLKHPVCYFEATHANSHGYYTITKCRAINDYYTFNNDICMEMSEMNVHYLDKSGYLRYAFVQALSAFEKLPLVGLTTSIGFMAWLTAVLGLWLARCKAKPVLPVFIGLGIFWLTCIASPVNDCMRYFLPVAGCLPLVFCLAAVFSREKSEITV